MWRGMGQKPTSRRKPCPNLLNLVVYNDFASRIREIFKNNLKLIYQLPTKKIKILISKTD